jgi:osmoprotectant transport system substrate-binding protein
VLAQLYGQALEARGFKVVYEPGRGPRELMLPALQQGLVEFLPEYAGTALQFVSLGSVTPSPDRETTNRSLRQALAGSGIEAMDPAKAENTNSFVVTRTTADRHGLAKISDLGPVASSLRFGGPPECPSRPFCLQGLRDTYGLTFQQVLALDAGGPRTHDALGDDYIDVAMLFSTDPSLATSDLVPLEDDRKLEPAENVTPLVRSEVLQRWGQPLRAALEQVSTELTTPDLRQLNSQVESGDVDPARAAAAWLAVKGLS